MSKNDYSLIDTLNIKCHLEENLKLTDILKIVNEEILKNNPDTHEISRYTLTQYIENNLGFKYDGKHKNWISIEPNKRIEKRKDVVNNQIGIFDNLDFSPESKFSSKPSEATKSNNSDKIKDQYITINKQENSKKEIPSFVNSAEIHMASKSIEPNNNSNPTSEENYNLEEVINNLNTLLKNVGTIQANVNMLMKRTGLITPKNVIQTNNALIIDFMDKYNSNYENYSVHININLMIEIETNLKTQYGIEPLDISHLLNISLFLLLFKDNI